MKLKVIVYKVSLNSNNIFSLRKTPELLKDMVYKDIKKLHTVVYSQRTLSYALQIIDEISENNTNIILGRMIKYRKVHEVEKWDEVNQKIDIVDEENNILEKVHFYYDRSSEYLIFEERSQLDIDTFTKAFQYIINFNNFEIQIDMNPLLHEKELSQRINRLQKITWAHFEIIPNNPDQRIWSMFETINEDLASTNSEYDFKNPDGLKRDGSLVELINDVNSGKSRRYIIGGYTSDKTYDEVRSHEHIKRLYLEIEPSDEGRKKGLWEITKEVLDL